MLINEDHYREKGFWHLRGAGNQGNHPWVLWESWERMERTLSWEMWEQEDSFQLVVSWHSKGRSFFSTSTSFREHRAQIMFHTANGLSLPTSSGNLPGNIWWLEMTPWLESSEDFFIHTRGAFARLSWELGWQMEVWPLWSLASSQHGGLKMVGAYSIAVQGSKCAFSKETRQKLNFLLWSSLGGHIAYSYHILVSQAVTSLTRFR